MEVTEGLSLDNSLLGRLCCGQFLLREADKDIKGIILERIPPD